jgi:hypothetical protein
MMRAKLQRSQAGISKTHKGSTAGFDQSDIDEKEDI